MAPQAAGLEADARGCQKTESDRLKGIKLLVATLDGVWCAAKHPARHDFQFEELTLKWGLPFLLQNSSPSWIVLGSRSFCRVSDFWESSNQTKSTLGFEDPLSKQLAALSKATKPNLLLFILSFASCAPLMGQNPRRFLDHLKAINRALLKLLAPSYSQVSWRRTSSFCRRRADR